MRKILLFIALLAVPLINLKAQNITQTEQTGPVLVTIKVLPAESFKGPNAEMAWDGGARPVLLSHSLRPDHHMVVFLKEEKRPVEMAKVTILYRENTPDKGRWTLLPVARMHIEGKSLKTTHFGNNVDLKPWNYEVIVVVNQDPHADFHFKLTSCTAGIK